MVDVPRQTETKPWNPTQMQAADALSVHRGSDGPSMPVIASASGASVPRKAISLGDFTGIKRDVDEGRDYLHVPKELIPDGIAIEWKRDKMLNMDDKQHRAEVWRAGWRHIPSDSAGFKEHFFSFITGDIFEYQGLVLMYRPLTMSEQAKKEEARKAGAVVEDKFAEIGMTSSNKDIPGKRFKLERGFEEKLPGGNPAAVAVPE